jgi:hypothetical protein
MHPTLHKSIPIEVVWPSSGILHVSFSAPSLGALLRGRVPQEHDWTDDFIAPLDGVHKPERELGKIGRPRQRLPLEMVRQ